ncbi:putative Zn-dependent peptidase [Dysgonomonas sp. PH5-45]|uniref:M16 family metallopeptidase n=1 Tax=unclassified Dysgonomonas TaxID=2630389 RepID=UPI0024746795|nr:MULTISPECIES: pitrilysin family protein [unclassified Dysgonomonas]MDH6353731.1 putative Zn-dependent peptidase [Dysgonomonas sp. PH5-45]MDH6386634.1 putative Zn-dependent peptidase [Dysgonomonas sp. PH5-37]
MVNYQSYTLQNGLRLVHKHNTSRVSYAGFIVNVGTRDEADDEYGMAHFIEHMLFKGTAKRTSRHIINRVEAVGGDLNAYTNKEETVLYSAFLEEDFERIFELLSDMIFSSDFPQKEIDKEVEVIIDEINSYEDSPSELIFDEFENLLFRSTQFGHNILGTKESLLTFDTEKAKRFFSKYYVPENMVFFSYGQTKFEKIVRLAEKYLAGICSSPRNTERIKPANNVPSEVKVNKETSQVHAIIGATAYTLHDPKRHALYLLNNILGGPGMNSRLNLSLREKKGYVYNVESSISSFSDTGMFSIYFGTDEKNFGKCIELVYKELDALCRGGLTSRQFQTAKKQLLGQIAVHSDNNESIAQSLGKNFLHYNHFDSPSETYSKINLIKEDDLFAVANDIFQKNKLSCLIYL